MTTATTPTSLDRLLSAEEVADLVGISPKTLYNQRARAIGLGGLGFRIGGHVRWRASAVAAYIDDCEREDRR